MAKLIIDGLEVQAEEGQTVLEVAKANKIEIPTLCHHPLLEPYGACRMCTVEIVRRGRSSLETACTYPAWDGIEVKTNSPPVMEARKAIMGLFLSRCPNVSVIQDLARQYGVTEPPFPTDTPDEKCILCGLCVRTCHELVKADVLNFAEAGPERVVGPAFMEKTRQCIGCGHCASACHFYVSTHDEKYTPIRKLDLLKRVYRREVSPLRWLQSTEDPAVASSIQRP